MEEPQSLQISGEEENGDEFYEKIEAPTFVDLTAPDNFLLGDDRYWFCLRVGCDQKHEEEMDSDAIYKNFVLRVMAARSPNIRLRKALNRKDSSTNVKCPQTVPAKSSKPRLSRLALISSMSKRTVDPKVKIKPLSKQTATPNAKTKQSSVVAKARTTPGNKKRLSNPNAFQSVRNSKATSIAVPKNRVIAKALVFDSPKKSARAKTSSELKTPVKTLCAGMKKLDITSGKKHVLGYDRSLPSRPIGKHLRGREVKSRVYDGLNSENCKNQESKSSSKCLKERNKEKNLKPVLDEVVEDDFSDMEIEEKPNNGSLEARLTTKSGGGNVHPVPAATTKDSNSSLGENEVQILSDCDVASGRVLNEANGKIQEDEGKSSSEKVNNDIIVSDDKKHNLSSDKENDGEVMDSDDKENASASDGNRELGPNVGHLERKVLGKHETRKGSQKTTRAMGKASKLSSTTSASGTQGLKHRKPKPTNPKPFRLRTDERGILKEANLEKRLHLAPLQETASVPRFPGGSLLKKHQNAIQKNKKGLEQTECGNDTFEGSEEETNSTQTNQPQNGTSSVKILGRKLSTTPQRHTVSSQQKLVVSRQEYSQSKAAKKLEKSLKKTRSPFMRQLASPGGSALGAKEMVSIMAPSQLLTLKETSSAILSTKDVSKPSDNSGVSPVTKPHTSAASRPSLLGGKRFTTIPKEPNFHTINLPRSCIRRAA